MEALRFFSCIIKRDVLNVVIGPYKNHGYFLQQQLSSKYIHKEGLQSNLSMF